MRRNGGDCCDGLRENGISNVISNDSGDDESENNWGCESGGDVFSNGGSESGSENMNENDDDDDRSVIVIVNESVNVFSTTNSIQADHFTRGLASWTISFLSRRRSPSASRMA